MAEPSPMCSVCQTPILGTVIDDGIGNTLHQDCLRCKRCGTLVNGNNPCDRTGSCVALTEKKCTKCRVNLGRIYTTTSDGCDYHIECIRCSVCGDILRGSYGTVDGQPVCAEDLKKRRKICDFCSKPIQTTYVENAHGLFHPPCSPFQRELQEKQCKFCQKSLKGESSISKDKTGYYHPACFTCSVCRKPIEQSFIRKENGEAVHHECSILPRKLDIPLHKEVTPKPAKSETTEADQDLPSFQNKDSAQKQKSEASLKQNEVLLGVQKMHVSKHLQEFLQILMKEGSRSRKVIAEHIEIGVTRMRKGYFSRAKDEFKKAVELESTIGDPDAESISQLQLFAKVMIHSFSDNFKNIGPCFRPLEDLTNEEKNFIVMDIDHALKKNRDCDKLKQLTFNLRTSCNDGARIDDDNRVEATINYGSLPTTEDCAAHLQIWNVNKKPVNFYLWTTSSHIFLRQKLKLFTIPINKLEKDQEKTFNIRIDMKENPLKCIYGNEYCHTASVKTRFPDFLLDIGKLVQAFKKTATFGPTTPLEALQQMINTSDNYLLDIDVNINKKDIEGNTLLHHAYCSRDSTYPDKTIYWQDRLRHQGGSSVSYVQLLVEAGADLSAKNNHGHTPLMYALQALQQCGKNKEKIKMLIQYSKPEEINDVDNEGNSALHHISALPWTTYFDEIIKLMCERGANVAVENNKEYNPRDWAKKHENEQVQKILKEHIFHDSPRSRRRSYL